MRRYERRQASQGRILIFVTRIIGSTRNLACTTRRGDIERPNCLKKSRDQLSYPGNVAYL
jgi:hypothetical protein